MPPLPDEDLDFEVEALIDKRSHNGTTEYKVLWRGYSEEAASWEPVENLNCPDLIQEYESVVGHPGSSHDVRVWASGSGIVAKPRLHLDEGEFVWVDAGYGYSSYTVGPYSNTAAAKSRDLHYFNYSLSHIRVKAEHGIAYLKNHFQCLMGFQGNLY
ncbi:hypothetical protein NDA17_007436 [Ustilago hordei]|nr:hypothetical protein NDA17_007436 [Ustilago hordei]